MFLSFVSLYMSLGSKGLRHYEQKLTVHCVTCDSTAFFTAVTYLTDFGHNLATFFCSKQFFLFNVKLNTLYLPGLFYKFVHLSCILHSACMYIWTGMFIYITTNVILDYICFVFLKILQCWCFLTQLYKIMCIVCGNNVLYVRILTYQLTNCMQQILSSFLISWWFFS
jgi:hypothetical protein